MPQYSDEATVPETVSVVTRISGDEYKRLLAAAREGNRRPGQQATAMLRSALAAWGRNRSAQHAAE